jgi:hypothetical protein
MSNCAIRPVYIGAFYPPVSLRKQRIGPHPQLEERFLVDLCYLIRMVAIAVLSKERPRAEAPCAD